MFALAARQRAGHLRLNGETVGINEKFSNGASWPGDTRALTVDEVANCHCEIELTITDGEYEFNEVDRQAPSAADAPGWRSGKHFADHARRHASAFGFDFRTEEGRFEYEALFVDTVDNYQRVVYTRLIRGQEPDQCAVFIKGENIAVMNMDAHQRVTLFKYSAGVSYIYDRIWNQIRG